MELHSHGAFNITGYKITIPNQQEAVPLITQGWEKRSSDKMDANIIDQEHPSMHAIYYNYTHTNDGDTI